MRMTNRIVDSRSPVGRRHHDLRPIGLILEGTVAELRARALSAADPPERQAA